MTEQKRDEIDPIRRPEASNDDLKKNWFGANLRNPQKNQR